MDKLEQDVCSVPGSESDPVCRARKCSLWTNIWWATVLICVMFFYSSWYNIIDHLLERAFGKTRSPFIMGMLGFVSLVIMLVLACIFEVDISY